MRLLGRNHLQKIRGLSDQTDKWLAAWVSEVTNAKWKAPVDVVTQFRAVTKASSGTFLFQIEPIDGFVELLIAFPQGVTLITSVENRL